MDILKIFGRRKKALPLPKWTLEDLKQRIVVLFIDDQSFRKVEALRDKEGWVNTKRIKDVERLDQKDIKDAHIIFVDINGVGRKLEFPDQGLGLIVALHKTYPMKKLVMYSAEQNGKIDAFHPAADLLDGRLKKTASLYEFSQKIEELSKDAFSLSSCIAKIKNELKTNFNVSLTDDEIERVIQKLYSKRKFNDKNAICKYFSIDNATTILEILKLFFSLC